MAYSEFYSKFRFVSWTQIWKQTNKCGVDIIFVKDLQNRGQASQYSLHSRHVEGSFILHRVSIMKLVVT